MKNIDDQINFNIIDLEEPKVIKINLIMYILKWVKKLFI